MMAKKLPLSMAVIAALCIFSLASSVYSGQGRVFRIHATDTSGTKHTIDAGGIASSGGFSLFGGGSSEVQTELSFHYGMAEVSVPFEHIRKVEVLARDKKEAKIKVYLQDGKVLNGKIRSKTVIQGSTTYASQYKISFLYLKEITFEALAGDSLSCSKCRRNYWKKDWKFCPYDGTELK